MQAQTTGRLREYRHSRMILGVIAGLALLVASILGIQTLIGGQATSETQRLSPVNVVAEDPPLPDTWADPYFNPPAAIPDQQDPPLPDGWVDPYFEGSDSRTAPVTDTYVGPMHGEGLPRSFEAPAIVAEPASIQERVLENPQGEGYPRTVVEQADGQELAPLGEGLPKGAGQ